MNCQTQLYFIFFLPSLYQLKNLQSNLKSHAEEHTEQAKPQIHDAFSLFCGKSTTCSSASVYLRRCTIRASTFLQLKVSTSP